MRFLVVQTRHVGDVLLSSSLCNALKAVYPDASIDMLTMDHCVGVLERNPHIDEVLVLERKRRNQLGYMAALLGKIRRKRYDVVLNLQGQLIGLLVCVAAWSGRRIGFNRFPWRLAHTDSVRLRGHSKPSCQGWTIDDRFTLLAPVSAADQTPSYRIWLDEAEVARGRALLEGAGFDFARPIVALGINARVDYKCWPREYYAELAEWLIETHCAQLLVFHGPGEKEYSKGLRPMLSEHNRAAVFDDVDIGPVRELAMVFRHCALYVGNDTGPRHIAQAVDLPALAIVSPSIDKRAWIPWNQPRYRAIDTGDALGLDRVEWQRRRAQLIAGSAADRMLFRELPVEFVRSEVDRMISDLRLFA